MDFRHGGGGGGCGGSAGLRAAGRRGSGPGGAERGGARAWRCGARWSAGLAWRSAGLELRGAGPECGAPRCGPSVAAEAREGPGGLRQGFAGCAGHSSPHCRRRSPPRGWDTGVHTLGDFALSWCFAGSGKGRGWLGGGWGWGWRGAGDPGVGSGSSRDTSRGPLSWAGEHSVALAHECALSPPVGSMGIMREPGFRPRGPSLLSNVWPSEK